MTGSPSDRNLLFGILALQMDFISREKLITAASSWVRDKTKPLDQILLEQGALAEDAHALLLPLVEKHLQMHDNDPQKSLASVSSVGTSVREQLQQLGDQDVEASLGHIAKAKTDHNVDATQTFTVGDSTSRGERFRILRPHAKGGLGQVSVAIDSELNREVALKEIQDHHADNQDSRSRFVLEAEITGGLEHPGIVPVYGLGQYSDGRPFYAMRFIKGDSLKEAIDRYHQADALPKPERALQLRKLLGRFIDVCYAIEYAHSRGVLHRDLKPGNIMLGKYGETLVVDWGLAKSVGRNAQESKSEEPTLRPSSGSDSAPTQMGSAIGTPAYMSPEQAAGRLDLLGPPSDVYNLGATLYYLLTGHVPFSGDNAGEVLRRVENGDFASPRAVQADVPKVLEAICLKAMSLKTVDRYATPRVLAEDVEKWLADEPVSAHSESVTEMAGRWMRRHRSWTLAGGTALLIIAIIATVSFVFVNEALRKENEQRHQAEVARLDAEVEKRLANDEKTKAEQARQLAMQAKIDLQKELRLSTAFRLTAESQAVRSEFSQRSVLLAVEAIKATRAHGDPVHSRVEQNILDALQSIGGRPLSGHKGPVVALALSAGGKRLVTGSRDRTLIVWDLEADDLITSAKVLKGHQDWITKLALSADGNRLVTSSEDKRVRLWDLSIDDPNTSAIELQGRETILALSADGKRLVTRSDDMGVRLWDLEADDIAASVVNLKDNESKVTGILALSADGKRLVTKRIDNTAQVWDLTSGDPVATSLVLKGLPSHVYVSAIDADGKRLVAGGHDKIVRVWDLGIDDPSDSLKLLMGHQSPIAGLVLSADGKRLVTRGVLETTVRVWDLQADDPNATQIVLKGHKDRITEIALSADSKWLATGSRDKTARVWNLEVSDPNVSATVFRGHEDHITALVLSTNGERLVTGSLDGTVRLWDLQTENRSALATVFNGHADYISTLALSENGKRLATGSKDNTVRVWDLMTDDPSNSVLVLKGTETLVMGQRDFISQVAISANGKRLAARSYANSAQVWDLEADEPGATSKVLSGHTGPIKVLVLSADGCRLATGSRDHTVRVWDLKSSDPIATSKVLTGHKDTIQAIALSKDSRWLFTGSLDNTVRVWNLEEDEPTSSVKVFRGHRDGIWQMVLSKDENTLITSSADHTARVWNLRAKDPNKSVTVLKGHGLRVKSMALSSDSRWLATGSEDRTARVWDLRKDDPSASAIVLKGHEGPVTAIALSADNSRLITLSSSSIVRIWNLEADDPNTSVIMLKGHLDTIHAMALSADGKLLFTGSQDKTVRSWLIEMDDLVAAAHRAAGRKLSAKERKRYLLESNSP